MKKTAVVLLLLVISVLLFSGCLREKDEGTGTITDKWASIVRDGTGSREASYFEINNTFFIEVTTFDYHNFEVNQTYHYRGYINEKNGL